MRNSGRGIDRLYRSALSALTPYQPILPPGSGEKDNLTGPIIKLDGNENVYGCSPRVQAALKALDQYHIYPDPEQRRLRKALEGYTGISQEHILAGAGSDELIALILRLFIDTGDKVIDCVPTFGMYSFNTLVCGGEVTRVERTATYHVDVDAVLRAVDSRTKVIFIASPNNPTGTMTQRRDITRLLESGVLVVVDEAYYEFCGQTVAGLVPEHDNLVVLRTFSKWAGLAGLRVGYGMFPEAMVRKLMTIKDPYNVNVAAEVAVLESLADREYLLGTVRALVEERDRMFAALGRIGYLAPVPSEANFVLCKVSGRGAQEIQEGLREKGIFIRYFNTPLLSGSIRISAGKPEHTDAVVRELRGMEVVR